MKPIKFGTDGWRAVVGEDFTPENVGKMAQAFADLYPRLQQSGGPISIGYDRRNQSPEAARQIASILVGNNIPCLLSSSPCPTPTVAWYAKKRGCEAGIMVTASHNPPKWNGIKFKESYGGAASAEYCAPIEETIIANDRDGKKPKVSKLEGNKLFSLFDPLKEYASSFAEFIDVKRLRKTNLKVLIEPLYGSGIGFYKKILGDVVTEMHNIPDINFGGVNPEPIPPHVNGAIEEMKKGKYDICLILDGDADRAGAIDEHGNFITTHEVFSLLIRHAIENKKWSGKIIKSISTTQMIDKIGKKYFMPVDVTPVGFKYISPAMKEEGVLVGGEESGGFGFPRHIPERDGLFSGLMLLELMVTTGKSIGTLVSDLQKEFGPCKYRRNDYHLSVEQIASARAKFNTLNIKEINGIKVKKHTTIDGHHFLFEDNSWMLFRASGTEPLIRTYAEAPTSARVETYLAEAGRLLGL